jgi:hypothetical protein
MRGETPNSHGARLVQGANAIRENHQLSPYSEIFSMKAACFQDFAEKSADHLVATQRK